MTAPADPVSAATNGTTTNGTTTRDAVTRDATASGTATGASAPVRTTVRPHRSFRSTVLRCTSAMLDRTHIEGRCQLLAGHTGPHAVVYIDAGLRRTVRSWSGDAPEAWADSWTAFQRPWALGFPSPTWTATGV